MYVFPYLSDLRVSPAIFVSVHQGVRIFKGSDVSRAAGLKSGQLVEHET